jgi:hypothetical protein
MTGWQMNNDNEQRRVNIYALGGIRTYGLRIQPCEVGYDWNTSSAK